MEVFTVQMSAATDKVTIMDDNWTGYRDDVTGNSPVAKEEESPLVTASGV